MDIASPIGQVLHQTTVVIDMIVVAVLLIGFVLVTIQATSQVIHGNRDESFSVTFRHLRVNLGQVLLLALEILILSDIILSILHRSLEDIYILGLTVLIRVLLAFFLNMEINHLQQGGENDDS